MTDFKLTNDGRSDCPEVGKGWVDSAEEMTIWGYGLDRFGNRTDVEAWIHEAAPSDARTLSTEQIKDKNRQFREQMGRAKERAIQRKEIFHAHALRLVFGCRVD